MKEMTLAFIVLQTFLFLGCVVWLLWRRKRVHTHICQIGFENTRASYSCDAHSDRASRQNDRGQAQPPGTDVADRKNV